jgi:alkylated DNA repair protein alkB homolog 8
MTPHPFQFVAICNAGLTTGLLQEQILDEISAIRDVTVENITMLPGKSYCFLEFQSTIDAKKAYDSMNGQARLAQNNGVVYLSYCDNIPSIDNLWKSPPPPGLVVLAEFISPDEEKVLMDAIDWGDLGEQNQTLKHRQVKHYGFEFIYGANNVNPDQPLAQSIPKVCDFLWDRLSRLDPTFVNFVPDQLTVNKYQPGHGVSSNILSKFEKM